MPASPTTLTPRTPRHPRIRRFARIVLRGIVGLVGLLGVFGVVQWITWPDVGTLASANPTGTAFIDHYRSTTEREGPLQWEWIGGDEISIELWKAVVAAEDIEFFTHGGFSTSELGAAIRQAWADRRAPRGASTITQQLAKNLWLSPSRNPWRKVKEALLTRQLERFLTKRRILELYLNVVEFGDGIYGAEAAARHYYGKSAHALTRREAALLAAALPRPGSWHPGVTANRYLASADRVEARMLQYRAYLDRHLRDGG